VKSLETYESFISKLFNREKSTKVVDPNINDYDRQYFFQDFIDNYNMEVEQSGFSSFNYKTFNKSFNFKLFDRNQREFNNFWYKTNSENRERELRSIDNIGELSTPMKELIQRVESFGGQILIIHYDTEDFINIYISTDTFDLFKN